MLEFRKLTVSIRVAPAIKEYVVDLVRATRDPAAYGPGLAPLLELGASPRATIAPIRAARGHALLARRDYVTPHDVKTLARDVMRHRIMISYEADAEGLSADNILDHIPVPQGPRTTSGAGPDEQRTRNLGSPVLAPVSSEDDTGTGHWFRTRGHGRAGSSSGGRPTGGMAGARTVPPEPTRPAIPFRLATRT